MADEMKQDKVVGGAKTRDESRASVPAFKPADSFTSELPTRDEAPPKPEQLKPETGELAPGVGEEGD